MKCVHIIISGRVQGVFFRAQAERLAKELDVRGWIRNTSDGKVEAVAEGKEDGVAAFIAFCRKGPQHAVVEHVSVTDLKGGKKFNDFTIQY
jgi:acylphosphatase